YRGGGLVPFGRCQHDTQVRHQEGCNPSLATLMSPMVGVRSGKAAPHPHHTQLMLRSVICALLRHLWRSGGPSASPDRPRKAIPCLCTDLYLAIRVSVAMIRFMSPYILVLLLTLVPLWAITLGGRGKTTGARDWQRRC